MKKLLVVLVVIFTLVVLNSCAKKITFPGSVVVPAAVAVAKVKQDKNKNYAIDLDVKHLAKPDKLSPSRKYYVVWMATENNGNKNLGQIKSSGSLISSTLKGSLKAVTSFKPTEIFITAEDDANIQWPGSFVVLRSESINVK